MHARLICRVGELKGQDFLIQRQATIGRGAANTIVLEPRAISAEHARLTYDPDRGCFLLEDLGSTNGTLLDGVPVHGQERLGGLHVLTFGGEHDFIFQDLGIFPLPEDARASADEGPPSKGPVHEATGAAEILPLPPGIAFAPRDVEKTRIDRSLPGLPLDLEALKGSPQKPAKPTEPARPAKPEKPEKPEKPDGVSKSDGAGQSDGAGRLDGASQSDSVEGTVFDLSISDLPFSLPGSLPGAASTGKRPSAPALLPAAFVLEVQLSPGSWQAFPLWAGENRIGRDQSLEVCLDHAGASRLHALLTIEEEKVTVRDLGSRNGTFVGGEKIDGEVVLHAGDALRFGDIEARLVASQDEETRP
jgi:pSer/pThr/pTyr-binding forkhead associated (FHA) protein